MLYIPIKERRFLDETKKEDPTIYYLQEMCFKYKDTERLKLKGERNIT